MKKLKFNQLLALASTISMIAGSQAVYAQKATDPEEIIVTGFKASLAKAAEIKQDTVGIVDLVTSEDIGKLPDKSIAESLMRLPGLATQRVNGRAQVISIRGFAPEFSTTLLNGRQQASTNENRAVEYDQYPAEFTSAAVVYKTPSASLLAQGVAGTIDIQTVKPLAYGKQAIIGSVRYEENEKASLNSDVSNKGYRGTISYIDQFNDDTLGLALAFSGTNSPTQGEKFNAWDYKPQYRINGTTDGLTSDATSNGIANEFLYDIPGGAKPFVQSDVIDRNSVMGTLEFEPNENLHSTVDLFYSKFKETQTLRGIELPLGWSSAILDPGFTVNDHLVTKGTFSNVKAVIRNDATIADSTVYALGWNTKFAMGESWNGNFDISRSSAERDTEVLENYSGYVGATDTISFESGKTGMKYKNALDYTDASKVRITNLQGWSDGFIPAESGGQKGFDSFGHVEDTLDQIRLSANRDIDFPVISNVEVGIAHDKRTKKGDGTRQFFIDLANGAVSGPLPSGTGTANLGFLGLDSIISYDPLAPKNQGLYKLVPDTRSSTLKNLWTVDETITTAYVKLAIETDVADMPITGDVGVQYVGTDQSSDGFSGSGEIKQGNNTLQLVPDHGGASFNNVLPSLNLKLAITEQDLVKLGLGRSLTRPGMTQMRVTNGYNLSSKADELESNSIDHSPWSASGGNPELKPWLSDSADLSFEHYFDDSKGYVSVASFYKELASYIYNKTTVKDFTGYYVDPATAAAYPNLMRTGLNNVPQNGSGGIVKGLEFTLSVTGDIFADALSGFGAVLTSSYTESNITPPDTKSKKLPGLSKNVHGAQVYYEQGGFSVRISENYRSSFLGDFSSNVGDPVQRVVNATTLLDAQIGYTFDSGALDGLGLSLQGYNLNDEPTVSADKGDQARVIDYQSYGRTFALNATYKF